MVLVVLACGLVTLESLNSSAPNHTKALLGLFMINSPLSRVAWWSVLLSALAPYAGLTWISSVSRRRSIDKGDLGFDHITCMRNFVKSLPSSVFHTHIPTYLQYIHTCSYVAMRKRDNIESRLPGL